MGKEKKKTKKKKDINLRIVVGFITVIVLGICYFLFRVIKDNVYLNNVVDSFVCESGHYLKNSLFSDECVECEEGYYCPGDDERHPCPIEGTTTRGKGSTTRYECE